MTPHIVVPLRDVSSGTFAIGVLIERIDIEYAKRADDAWDTYVAAERARAKYKGLKIPSLEHGHWQWGEKVAASAHLLSLPTFALESGGEAQGLMLVQTDGCFGRLPEQKGKPLVYITYLSAAPWNLRAYGTPRFQGVGQVLLRAAIEKSIELEFKGRIGLHSLPQSESFYQRRGMKGLGRDADKENLEYFEMTADAASEFIKKGIK